MIQAHSPDVRRQTSKSPDVSHKSQNQLAVLSSGHPQWSFATGECHDSFTSGLHL
mgnify:CR=1 FL=1